MTFSPDGKLLATGSFDWTVQLWDTETGQALGEKLSHNGRVQGVVFSPDGRLLASRSLDRTVGLWSVATRRPYGRPLRHTSTANRIIFGPDSKLLITTEMDGTTRIWKIEREPHTQVVLQQNGVRTGYTSANGKVRAIFSKGTVQFRDTTTDRMVGKTIRVGGNILATALSPQGKLLGTCHDYWKASIWDVSSGQMLQELDCGERAYAVAFSPDAKALATGLRDGTVILWDVATGERIGPPLQHRAPLQAVAFSPDGNLLATASGKEPSNTIILLWDISSGRPHHSLVLPLGQPVRGKAALGRFNSDGMIRIEKLENGTSRMWQLPTAAIGLQEMRLRTWIALATQRDDQYQLAAILWEQHRRLRKELSSLLGKTE